MLDSLAPWLGEDVAWFLSYVTNGKHLKWYASVQYTLIAAFAGALLAVAFGLLGASLRGSRFAPFRLVGLGYTSVVRGVPDVLFFLSFPLAFEITVEYFSARSACSAEQLATRAGWPPCPEAQWFLTKFEYLVLACVSLGIVFGAFAANVIHGAMQAVPKGQLEAARAFGFTPRQVYWRFHVRQMWVYALPGLSNVWMLLLKATSLLSLLQIQDIVYWAGQLGAANYFRSAGHVHPDWRWKYYLALFVFYIVMTLLSERVFAALRRRAAHGLAVAD